jgi:NADP-dependent 3-hydroxy acid dehydrogenase YdfG
MTTKTWFITGASSGFGRAFAEHGRAGSNLSQAQVAQRDPEHRSASRNTDVLSANWPETHPARMSVGKRYRAW